jgi:hypothetical protein
MAPSAVRIMRGLGIRLRVQLRYNGPVPRAHGLARGAVLCRRPPYDLGDLIPELAVSASGQRCCCRRAGPPVSGRVAWATPCCGQLTRPGHPADNRDTGLGPQTASDKSTAYALCLAKPVDSAHGDHLRQQAPFGSMLRTGDFGWRGTSSNTLTPRGPRGPATRRSAERTDELTAQD